MPGAALGLRMDDHTLRVAVGLRLDTPIVAPLWRQHCGEEVDCQGTYGLSYWLSKGRNRHVSDNSIIPRALTTAKIPWRLESADLSRSDGKHPDREIGILGSSTIVGVGHATYTSVRLQVQL